MEDEQDGHDSFLVLLLRSLMLCDAVDRALLPRRRPSAAAAAAAADDDDDDGIGSMLTELFASTSDVLLSNENRYMFI